MNQLPNTGLGLGLGLGLEILRNPVGSNLDI